jgi:hypothetical protein
MANSAVVNNLLQVVPILTLVPPTASPQLYLLLARERIVIDTLAIGQDLMDKANASPTPYVTITNGVEDALSEGFSSFE